MEYEEFFKMMGFEDSEDLGRNCPSMPVRDTSPAVEQPVRVEHHELPQISDAAYARATMEGPF